MRGQDMRGTAQPAPLAPAAGIAPRAPPPAIRSSAWRRSSAWCDAVRSRLRASRLTVARLARGLGTQAVIDRDGDEPRAARQCAAPAGREPHQRDRIRTAGDREHDGRRVLPIREQAFRIRCRDRRNCRRRAWAPPADVASLSRPGHAASPAGCADGPGEFGLQHFTRFCSRSTAALTPLEARGYFRVTSPNAAQAASFSFSAASDCPSRSKRVRRLRRFVEFGGHAEKGFSRIAVLLALEIGFRPASIANPPAADRSGYFCAKLRMVCFGQRVVLALHVADAEIELVSRRRRGRQGGQPAIRIGRRLAACACRIARAAGVGEIERFSGARDRRGRRPAPGCRAGADRRRARAARRERSDSGSDRRHRHADGPPLQPAAAPARSAPALQSADHSPAGPAVAA